MCSISHIRAVCLWGDRQGASLFHRGDLKFDRARISSSSLKGLIGILLGVGLSIFVDGMNIADMDVTTVVQPWSIGIAFLVSGGVGLLSGIYPAFRASKLDPKVALRTE